MDNPLLALGERIPFDRIGAEHVVPAVATLLSDARDRIDAIGRTADRTYAETLGALEASTERLELAMGVVGLIEATMTTPAFREAYNQVRPRVSELYSRIPTDERLWSVLQGYAGTDEAGGLPPTRRRHLDKTLDDFRRHGAGLSAGDKERLLAVDVELTNLTTRFAQNVLDSTNAFELIIDDEAKLAGLPDSARQAARQSARDKDSPGWRFTLQQPSVMAVLTYMDDARIRAHVWRAYNQLASSEPLSNRPLIDRILRLRRERARLLGFKDFADLVLEDRMARDGARAMAFVDDLRARTRPFADREAEELRDFRRQLEGADAPDPEPWDLHYYAEKLRQARYDFDEESLRPYFPADRVLSGLFEVVARLYGVRVERHELPTWHPTVRSYRLLAEDGELLALFYADLFPREQKRGGAWMQPLRTGSPASGATGPHIGLVCANVTPPVNGGPALLTHREVETLFHEFGHLIHHVLSRVEVRSLSGTNVAWDFVELPSQIMENWCWEREALDLFARHHETGEPIPADLYDRMRRARTFREATNTMRQIGFATVDLMLHREYDPERDGDVIAHARRILQEHTPAALPEDYAMITGFGHLFANPVGYAAGYYSYKWAEVLDADAFSRFQEEGVFSRDAGGDFRRHILSMGDSRDPMDLFVAFRGREPRIDALLRRAGLVS